MPTTTLIQIRRGTAAAWTSANPILAAGECGVETDTGKAKTGDGSTAWTSLGYDRAPLTTLLNRADHTGSQPLSTISDVTTVGAALAKLTNPSAVRYLRLNADNSVTALSASDMLAALGAFTGGLVIANNLSDLASVPTARTNLGLGTAATHAATDFDAAGAATTAAAAAQAAAIQRANHTGTQLLSTISDVTTVGAALAKLTNPGAVRYLRLNADNSVTALSAADMLTALGASTGGAAVNFATGTLTKITAPIAAQPATANATSNPGMPNASDGDTLTFTKVGASAGTVTFECDGNGDGVAEGNVNLGGSTGLSMLLPAIQAALDGSYGISASLSGDVSTTGATLSIASTATGAGESFAVTGTGAFASLAMSGAGSDAIAGTGTREVELAPAVSGKTNLFLSLSASVLGDTAWTGDVLICGKLGGTYYPRYRIVAPAATNTASTGRNYGMVVVPASWGPGQSIEPDRNGADEEPADLTAALPAGASIVAISTGTTLGTTIGDESTGSDLRIALTSAQATL